MHTISELATQNSLCLTCDVVCPGSGDITCRCIYGHSDCLLCGDAGYGKYSWSSCHCEMEETAIKRGWIQTRMLTSLTYLAMLLMAVL